MAEFNPKDILLPTYRAKQEQEKFFKIADKVRAQSNKLLHPTEVAGEYDIARGLLTMLGGSPRMITQADLRQFQLITKNAKTKFRKGITAKGVIDLSKPIPPQPDNLQPTDKERANKEIKFAIPVMSKGGTVRFMTNASPKSDRQRHYVVVEFINFEAIAASAIPTNSVGKEMAKSPLKISCSCGRWRFWLAYLATVGGYNSGHPETAFPKIRNPGLVGVGCKHILRVMWEIMKSTSINLYLRDMVVKARASTERQQQSVRITEQRKLADLVAKEAQKRKAITSTDERRKPKKLKNERDLFRKIGALNFENNRVEQKLKLEQYKNRKEQKNIETELLKLGIPRNIAEKLANDAMIALGKKS